MKMKIEIIKNNDSMLNEWNEFLMTQEEGNILQSSIIGDLFYDIGFDYNVLLAKNGSDIVGGALSTIWPGKRKYKLLSSFSTLKITYGPIATGADKKYILKTIINQVNKLIVKSGYMNGVIIMKQNDSKFKILNNLNFKLNPNVVGCTFIIDLSKPEDELWKNIGRKQHRNYIKRALESNVYIGVANSDNTPGILHDLHLETTRRLNISPYPYAYFLSIWNNLCKNNSAKVFFAYVDSKPVAASIILLYKDTIYDYINVCYDEAFIFNANKVLMWHMIKWGKEKGFNKFDLLFSPSNGGLYRYKKYFGGIEKPINYYEKIYSQFKWNIWSKAIMPIYNKIYS